MGLFKKKEKIVMTEEIQNLEVGSVIDDRTVNKANAGTLSKKDVKKLKKIKTTVTDAISYINAYDNGVLQVDTGVFSKTYKFDDIAFTSRSDDTQESIYEAYQKFLNALSPDIEMQIHFVNTREDIEVKLSQIAPPTRGSSLDKYAIEAADVLRQKLEEARNNIKTDKYISLTCKAESVDEAMNIFKDVEATITTGFSDLGNTELIPLALPERLELLHKIYNGSDTNFYFSHDEEGKVSCDFNRLAKQGLSTKNLVAPSGFQFDIDKSTIGDRKCGHLFVDDLPNYIEASFIASVCNLPFESVITLYINQLPPDEATKKVNSQATNIDAEISQREEKASGKGKAVNIPTDLRIAKENVELLQEDLISRDQKMFVFSMDMIYFAEDFDELKRATKTFKSTADKYSARFQKAMFLQEQAITSTLPYGKHLELHDRYLTTESVGVFMPFDEINQYDKGGIYYGKNRINNSPIIINRRKGNNYNALVLGSAGSGKSFGTKREITFIRLIDPSAGILIIDPSDEYSALTEALGGVVLPIAPGSGNYLNPLDLDIDNSFDINFNPMVAKIDFVMGFIETILNGAPLSPMQRSAIDTAMNNIYRPYLEHLSELPPLPNGKRQTIDRASCPTLQTLFEELTSSKNPEAMNLAMVLQPYVSGSSDLFAHHTNINVDNNFISFNLKPVNEMGIVKELAMKVCMNELLTRNQANRRQNKWTYMYIDEAHLFLNSVSTSSFFKTVWKTVRKFMGCPCAITQNVEDFIQSPDARAIINNTSFANIMNQSMMDRNMLQQLFQLTETDLKYITNVKRGSGLIWTAKGTFPYTDEFPEDTELYKLFNTSPTSV